MVVSVSVVSTPPDGDMTQVCDFATAGAAHLQYVVTQDEHRRIRTLRGSACVEFS